MPDAVFAVRRLQSLALTRVGTTAERAAAWDRFAAWIGAQVAIGKVFEVADRTRVRVLDTFDIYARGVPVATVIEARILDGRHRQRIAWFTIDVLDFEVGGPHAEIVASRAEELLLQMAAKKARITVRVIKEDAAAAAAGLPMRYAHGRTVAPETLPAGTLPPGLLPDAQRGAAGIRLVAEILAAVGPDSPLEKARYKQWIDEETKARHILGDDTGRRFRVLACKEICLDSRPIETVVEVRLLDGLHARRVVRLPLRAVELEGEPSAAELSASRAAEQKILDEEARPYRQFMR